MNDLTEALRRAAAPPTRDPSVAELQQELRARHRRRRAAIGVLSSLVAITAAGLLLASLRGDSQRTVSAAGDPNTATTVPVPSGPARPGDGFCEPQLTSAGYRITAPALGVVPVVTEQAAIDQARVYVGNDSGTFSAYFAMVRSPEAEKVGLGITGAARATWVVEVSGIVPAPRGADLGGLRGGAVNPDVHPPYRMVAFIDDATGTRAGAWAACDEPGTAEASAPTTTPAAGPGTPQPPLSPSTTLNTTLAAVPATTVPPAPNPNPTTSSVPLQNPPGCGVVDGLPANCPAQGFVSSPPRPGPPASPASVPTGSSNT